MVITRIVPLPIAKVAAVLYGMIGFAIGAIVSVVVLAGGFRDAGLLGPLAGGIIGIGAIVAVPLFYACIAFVAALVVAWLYNVAAGIAGGIEVDVK